MKTPPDEPETDSGKPRPSGDNDAAAEAAPNKQAGAAFGWRRMLPLALLIGFFAFAYTQGWHHYLTLERVAEARSGLQGFVEANFLYAVLIYIGVYTVVAAGSLPAGALLTVTGGFLFGPWIATAATVLGATLGASFLFMIAKTALGEPLAEKAGPWLHKVRAGFQKDAMSYLLFLRLVPAFPFWFVNLAPAFFGVPLRTYFIATFVGIIPGSFAFAYVGEGLNSIIREQEAAYQACLESQPASACSFSLDPGALLTTEVLIAFAALGIVALLPALIKRWRGKPPAAEDS